MWPVDGKDKDKETNAGEPAFLVGTDARPVRMPATDDALDAFKEKLFDHPGNQIVSVGRHDRAVVVITRGEASQMLIEHIAAVASKMSLGNAIVIQPE